MGKKRRGRGQEGGGGEAPTSGSEGRVGVGGVRGCRRRFHPLISCRNLSIDAIVVLTPEGRGGGSGRKWVEGGVEGVGGVKDADAGAVQFRWASNLHKFK